MSSARPTSLSDRASDPRDASEPHGPPAGSLPQFLQSDEVEPLNLKTKLPAVPRHKSVLARQNSVSRLKGPREFSPILGSNTAAARPKKSVSFHRTDEVIQYDTMTPEPDASVDNSDQFSWFDEPSDSPAWEAGLNNTLRGRPLPDLPEAGEHSEPLESPPRAMLSASRPTHHLPDLPQPTGDAAPSSESTPPRAMSPVGVAAADAANGTALVPPVFPTVPSPERVLENNNPWSPGMLSHKFDKHRLDLVDRVDAVMDRGSSPFVPTHHPRQSWQGEWDPVRESLAPAPGSPTTSDTSEVSSLAVGENPAPLGPTPGLDMLPAPTRKESLLESQRRPHTQRLSRKAMPEPPASDGNLNRTYSKRRREIMHMLDPNQRQVPSSIAEEFEEEDAELNEDSALPKQEVELLEESNEAQKPVDLEQVPEELPTTREVEPVVPVRVTAAPADEGENEPQADPNASTIIIPDQSELDEVSLQFSASPHASVAAGSARTVPALVHSAANDLHGAILTTPEQLSEGDENKSGSLDEQAEQAGPGLNSQLAPPSGFANTPQLDMPTPTAAWTPDGFEAGPDGSPGGMLVHSLDHTPSANASAPQLQAAPELEPATKSADDNGWTDEELPLDRPSSDLFFTPGQSPARLLPDGRVSASVSEADHAAQSPDLSHASRAAQNALAMSTPPQLASPTHDAFEFEPAARQEHPDDHLPEADAPFHPQIMPEVNASNSTMNSTDAVIAGPTFGGPDVAPAAAEDAESMHAPSSLDVTTAGPGMVVRNKSVKGVDIDEMAPLVAVPQTPPPVDRSMVSVRSPAGDVSTGSPPQRVRSENSDAPIGVGINLSNTPTEDPECVALPPLRRDGSYVELSAIAKDGQTKGRGLHNHLVLPDTIPRLTDPVSPTRALQQLIREDRASPTNKSMRVSPSISSMAYSASDVRTDVVERVPMMPEAPRETPKLSFIAPSPLAVSLPGTPAVSELVTAPAARSPDLPRIEEKERPHDFVSTHRLSLDSDLSDSSDPRGARGEPIAPLARPVEQSLVEEMPAPRSTNVARPRPVSSFAVMSSKSESSSLSTVQTRSEPSRNFNVSAGPARLPPSTSKATIATQASEISVGLEDIGESFSSMAADMERALSQPTQRAGYVFRESASVIKATSVAKRRPVPQSASASSRATSRVVTSGVPKSSSVQFASARSNLSGMTHQRTSTIAKAPSGSSLGPSHSQVFQSTTSFDPSYGQDSSVLVTKPIEAATTGAPIAEEDSRMMNESELPAAASTVEALDPVAHDSARDASRDEIPQPFSLEMPARGVHSSVTFSDGVVTPPAVPDAWTREPSAAPEAVPVARAVPDSVPAALAAESAATPKTPVMQTPPLGSVAPKEPPSPSMQRYLERRRRSYPGALKGEQGRLFVRVDSISQVQLPGVGARSASVTATLDNGTHCITTPSLALAAGVSFGNEYEFVATDELEIVCTLKASWDKPPGRARPRSATAVGGADRPRSVLNRLFKRGKPAPGRAAEVTQVYTEETYGWDTLMAKDGSFGRAALRLEDVQQQAFGQPFQLKLPCENIWADEAGGATSGANTCLLNLTVMFVPRLSRSEVLPATMAEALAEIAAARRSVRVELTGYMTQAGGDCVEPKRRYFVLDDDMLVAHSDGTHKPRVTINLRKAADLVPGEAASDFSVLFSNGETLQFRAEGRVSREQWLEALQRTMLAPRTRSPWLSLVLYGGGAPAPGARRPRPKSAGVGRRNKRKSSPPMVTV